jgi:plastocyanin
MNVLKDIMRKILAIFSIVAFVFSVGVLPQTAEASGHVQPLDEIESGDLIRGESHDAVYYYGEDGFRYVFPNSKTYFTWYDNFDDVKWISDEDLGTIQIGGNVTYKPGVKMVKITSDPKTYAVDEGGALRWVTTQEAAETLYGVDWNTKIDDVPDAFFSNYEMGADITDASEFEKDALMSSVASINENKDLKSPVIVQITDQGYQPGEVTTSTDRPVRFVNTTDDDHTATDTDLNWGSGTIKPGMDFIRYFEESGTYEYQDSYGSGDVMGTITVE